MLRDQTSENYMRRSQIQVLTHKPRISVIVEMDPLTGKSQSFAGSGVDPIALAVDSSTNRVAVTALRDDGLTIYNLANETGTDFQLAGDYGEYVAADERRGLFLVAEVFADHPSYGTYGYNPNNNFKSAAAVYDENGQLLATHEQFVLFNTNLNNEVDNLQVDPVHRTAYLIAPFDEGIIPFHY